jgi:hypothetical protein
MIDEVVMKVGFAPNYVDRLRYIFRLCADYYSFYLHKLWLMDHRELSGLLSVLVPLWKSRMYTIRMSPFLQVYLIRPYLESCS